MTNTKKIKEAKEAIYNAFRKDYLNNKKESISLIVVLLIWAKYIPETKKKIVGYFDALYTVDDLDEIKEGYSIQKALYELNRVRTTEIYSDLFNLKANKNRSIEVYRAMLIPAARLVVQGNETEITAIIQYIEELTFKSIGHTLMRPNELITDISHAIFDKENLIKDNINCFYQGGSLAASRFAENRTVYIRELNSWLENFTLGLISLYGKPFKFIKQYSKSSLTFIAPEFGMNLNKEDKYSPLNEDEESLLIKEINCKQIYLAHKDTKETTIAITSLNTLFSRSSGINYFRKILIDQNWLHTIIQLPTGIYSPSSIQTVLLVLKKDRTVEDKIYFLDFSDVKPEVPTKRGSQFKYTTNEIKALCKEIFKRKSSTISSVIEREKIIESNYDLNISKYVLSTEDIHLQKLLNKRKNIPLSDLVEIIRPLAITREENGKEIKEVMVSDINSIGKIENLNKKTSVQSDFYEKCKSTLIKEGDILISIKGTLGKIGLVTKEISNAIPGPSFCILRKRDSALIDTDTLYQYLRSSIGQRLITQSGQGATIPFISIKQLKELKIPVPEKEEQRKAKKIEKRSNELFNSIDEMQKELNQLLEKGWLQNDSKGDNK